MTDNVNHPAHYRLPNNLQAIDLIEALLTPEEFKGYLKGNILKYNIRADKKGNPEEDRRKAVWYTNYLLDLEADEDTTYEITPKGEALTDIAVAGFDIPLAKNYYVWNNENNQLWLWLTDDGTWRSELTWQEYPTEKVIKWIKADPQNLELRGVDD